jgi:hypothetical protein
MSTPPVRAYPPDNAAVLYYRACLLYQPDDAMKDKLVELIKGEIQLGEDIEKYVQKNRNAIDFVLDAADVESCDWGVDYDNGLATVLPYYGSLRHIAHLVLADAKVSAARGDYELALDRCLTARKMALHVGNGNFIAYLVGIAEETLANRCIQSILGDMPGDPDALTRLKSRLMDLEIRRRPLKAAVITEAKSCMTDMHIDRKQQILEFFSDDEIASSLSDGTWQRLRNADEEFFRNNKEYWQRHIDQLLAALDLPYQQAHARLKELEEHISRDVIEGPDATLASMMWPASSNILTLAIRAQTHSNAVRAAVRLYLINTQEGSLPDTLPADLPKDLFSGEDFEYETKADGFILRCRAKDLWKDKVYEYEFRVPN